ncbi:MAG: HAMP domain-containing protein [bacterium]|nr:HAMP domain-containing protein [bacterium]
MKRRIVICLGLLLGLCLLGDAIAMLFLTQSMTRFEALVDSHRIQTMRADLTVAGLRMETDLLAALAGQARSRSQHDETTAHFLQSLSACNDCHHTPAVQSHLDRVQAAYRAYRDSMTGQGEGGTALSADRPTAESRALSEQLVAETTELADLAALHLESRSAQVVGAAQRAWFILGVTLVAALVVGGLVASHLKRRLTRPMEALLDGTDRMRAGDATYHIPPVGDQEFCELALAFNHAHETLRAAQEGRVQAEKMAAVGTLAAGVAHEVNNPLASISMVAQRMRQQCQAPEQEEQIDLILKHIERISRIIRELLTSARPAAFGEHHRVDVADLLERTLASLQHDEGGEELRITCDCAPELPVILGNDERLMLVFSNLIHNALDALSAESGRDRFLAITAQAQGDVVRIQFRDNGVGMSSAQIRNALDPFFTTKEPGGRAGMGLWICYQVIQKHNGSISVDSRPGEGSTVTVDLPKFVVHQELARGA